MSDRLHPSDWRVAVARFNEAAPPERPVHTAAIDYSDDDALLNTDIPARSAAID